LLVYGIALPKTAAASFVDYIDSDGFCPIRSFRGHCDKVSFKTRLVMS
jgi:hypothetical protein